LLLGLGLIPAVVVAIGVRRITRPINELIQGAQAVAGGDFGHTITASTGDELAELVVQFNAMSVQLAASYSALQAREERLQLVMQATNDGIWDWDLRTDEVYYSPRWKEMLGYAGTSSAISFQWRLVHPEAWAGAAQVQPSWSRPL
jgi:signal transduction histidine kinase